MGLDIYKNKFKKRIFFTTIFLALILLYPYNVYAKEYSVEMFDTEEELNLSVCFIVDEVPIEKAKILIYKVADIVQENGLITYVSIVGDYNYENLSSDELLEAALELSGSDGLEDCDSLTRYTSSSGYADFNSLTSGMYLVILKNTVQNDAGDEYYFSPFLVSVPLAELINEEYVWTYDITAYPKSVSISMHEEEEEYDDDDEEEKEDDDDDEEEEEYDDDDEDAIVGWIWPWSESSSNSNSGGGSYWISAYKTWDTSNLHFYVLIILGIIIVSGFLLYLKKNHKK